MHQFRAAAQCVAYIAAAELQVSEWPDLLPALVGNVTSPQSTEQVKEASLDALGYICEDLVSFSRDFPVADWFALLLPGSQVLG